MNEFVDNQPVCAINVVLISKMFQQSSSQHQISFNIYTGNLARYQNEVTNSYENIY